MGVVTIPKKSVLPNDCSNRDETLKKMSLKNLKETNAVNAKRPVNI